MLDTLLANFPKGSLVAIIGDPAAYSGPRVCGLPADRRLLPNYMRTLRALARVDEVSMAVVCRAPKARETDIYSIPMDVSTIVDVIVSANDDGSYTVLKNRRGRSLYRIEPTTTPALPDLIPESAMTNADINASSASLPIAATPEATARFMASVYAWMGVGVATSAATAYLVASHPNTHEALTSGATGVCVVLAPFALIVALGYLSYKRRPYLAATAYLTLTLLMGVMFSSIAVKSAADAAFAGDVVTALVVSAGMFAGLALAGWTTRRDLSGWGTFLLSALWGLILAMVVNVFVGSTWLSLGISSAGVLLFSALTAYDVQAAKRSAHLGQGAAVVCALSLYLDFLNLFTSILGLSRADA